MEKTRKTPQRMCIACRRMRDKRDLLRVVRTPQGELQIDESGKQAGRGAYLCREGECLKKALKSRAIARTLGVVPDEELLTQVERAVEGEEQP